MKSRSKFIIICALFSSFQAFAGSPESIWFGKNGNKRVIVFSCDPDSKTKSSEDSKAKKEEMQEYCKVMEEFLESLKINPDNKAFLNLGSLENPDNKAFLCSGEIDDSYPRKILYAMMKNYNKRINAVSSIDGFFEFNWFEFDISSDTPFVDTYFAFATQDGVDKLNIPKEVKKYLSDKINKRLEALDRFFDSPFCMLFRKYDADAFNKMSCNLFKTLLNLKTQKITFDKPRQDSYQKKLIKDLRKLFGTNAKKFLRDLKTDKESNRINPEKIRKEIYNMSQECNDLHYLITLVKNLSNTKDPNLEQTIVAYSPKVTANSLISLLKDFYGFEEVCNTATQPSVKSGRASIGPKELRGILIEEIYPVSSATVRSSTSKLSSSSGSKLSSSSSSYSSSSSSPAPSSSSSSSPSLESSSGSSLSSSSSSLHEDGKISSSELEDQTNCNSCKKELKSSVSCNICGFKYCNDACKKEDEVNHFNTCVIRCINKLDTLSQDCAEVRDESLLKEDICIAFAFFNDFIKQNQSYLEFITSFFQKNPVGELANKRLQDVKKRILEMQANYLELYIEARRNVIDRTINISKASDRPFETTSSIGNLSEILYGVKFFLKRIRRFDEDYYKEKIKFVNILKRQLSATCENCCEAFSDGPLEVCSACFANGQRHYYCSEECQKEAWPDHKLICAINDPMIKKLQSIEKYINDLKANNALNDRCVWLLLWIEFKTATLATQQRIDIAKKYNFKDKLDDKIKVSMENERSGLSKLRPLLKEYSEWLELLDIIDYENRRILYKFYRTIYNAIGIDLINENCNNNKIYKPNEIINNSETHVSDIVIEIMKHNERLAKDELAKMNGPEIPSLPTTETKAPVNSDLENKESKEEAKGVATEGETKRTSAIPSDKKESAELSGSASVQDTGTQEDSYSYSQRYVRHPAKSTGGEELD